VVVGGGPAFGDVTIADRLGVLRDQHDWLRTALIAEPRGSDVMVGALVQPATDPRNTAAVIFFNNVGYLGMCGHGMIGVITTLAYLNRIGAGVHTLETPIGTVTTTLHEDGRVSVENVPSYRHQCRVSVDVPKQGTVVGDVAWGGNWFFLVAEHRQPLDLSHAQALTEYAWNVRVALSDQGIRGKDRAEIDHIELFGPPTDTVLADSRNFVLCPGRVYDRSPCGTGTSAKLACLAADGKLAPGQVWRQQSILGGVFQGRYRRHGQQIVPTITGQAYVNAEVTLIIDPDDPLKYGFQP
jgi:4-hydroxyproline epimerase